MSRRAMQRVTLALFVLPFLSMGFAQQTGKIGVINSQLVLEKSSEGKRVITQLTEKDKKNQSEMTKLDNEIKQIETKLSTQRLTLTDEAVIQMNSDLERKRTDQKRMSEDAVRELQELQYRLFNKVQAELIPIIEQIGKEKGMDVIFDLGKSGAVYFNGAIDVTDEVIRRYDAGKTAAAK